MGALQIFTLLGALGMFLYGMTIMSSGLQKASGDSLRRLLSAMTSNPFKGVLTGFGITSIIQSSSATTVMVVSFVNAGLLTLTQAIGVIMGANIGTTVTAWLVSWLGFKADISILAVPLMLVGFIFSNSKKNQRHNIGEMIVGFCLLFLGLSFMKESFPDLNEVPQALDFVKSWSGHGFGSVLIFLAFGTVLTLILQSSSATMAITLIMLNMEFISFSMACAMVLGENIGTTITANIAASVANTQAKRAAVFHTIFNVFGVIWALIFFGPFISLVSRIIGVFGLPEATASLYGLSLLHTLFNTINTFILIWFTKYIEKVVIWLVRAPKDQENEAFSLKYISAGPLATPELAVEQAFDDIIHFAQISRNGLKYARSAIKETDPDKFDLLRGKLVKYEEISDRIQYEIADFLNEVSAGDISVETSAKIKAMYRIIGELESLGDSGEAISRILSRKNIHKKTFDQASDEGGLFEISNAYNAENRINNMRNYFRDVEVEELKDDIKNYQTSVYFMDIVNELERMGDFMINISQTLKKVYLKR